MILVSRQARHSATEEIAEFSGVCSITRPMCSRLVQAKWVRPPWGGGFCSLSTGQLSSLQPLPPLGFNLLWHFRCQPPTAILPCSMRPFFSGFHCLSSQDSRVFTLRNLALSAAITRLSPHCSFSQQASCPDPDGVGFLY